MKQLTAWSFKACWQLTYGLIFGLIVYFAKHIGWKSSDTLITLAYFISNVLFNALLAGIIGGVILGCIIFPLQYYLIRRFNGLIAFIFLLVGFIMGSVLFGKL